MIDTKAEFKVPQPEEVSDTNRKILLGMKESLGMIPNIYATYAYSDHALKRYTEFSGGATSLNSQEKEVVNLVVSQINGCTYCQAAHTAMGQKVGFTKDQTIAIRKGEVDFDAKLSALAQLTHSIVQNRGKADDERVAAFLDAGYSRENLVDLILAIGDKTMTNYLHNITQIPVDFPEAPELS